MTYVITQDGGNVAPKTDLPGTPNGGSELCRRNLGSGRWPGITQDRVVCKLFTCRYLVQTNVDPLSSDLSYLR